MAGELALLAGLAWGWNPIGADWSWQDAPNEEPLYVHLDGFEDLPGTEAALRRAADAWNRQTDAAYAWDVAGDTLASVRVQDGVALVTRGGAIGGGVLAQAEVWLDGADMLECDIAFFSSNAFGTIAWSTDPAGAAPGTVDFERMAEHELGHCLGLLHSGESDAIMWPSQGFGTGVAERALHLDDIAGVEALYGLREGPLVVKTAVLLDDGGDGVFVPGEAVEVWIDLSNVGTETAFAVQGTLQGAVGPVSWGTLLPGDTVAAPAAFEVALDPGCAVDHVLSLALDLSDDAGHGWARTVAVRVDCGIPATADLAVVGVTVDDDRIGGSLGNGNGIPEIGERAWLWLELANAGPVPSAPMSSDLEPVSLWLNAPGPPRLLGPIAAGGSVVAGPYVVFVTPSCADPPADALLVLQDAGGTQQLDVAVDAACQWPAEPDLALAGWWVDGEVARGGAFDLWVEVDNLGDAPASATGALVTDPLLQADDTEWAAIDPGESGFAAFEVKVGQGCAADVAVALAVELRTPVGYDFDLSLGPLDVTCDLDVDGDGFPASVDCDDGDAEVWPGAPEACDATDHDCDGSPDAGAVDADPYFQDADADGFGAGDAVYACAAPDGHVSLDGDCDDGDGDTWPGAPEVCDGADQDCDGTPDDDAVDPQTWYADADSDGFGAGEPVQACDPPDGHVDNDDDCDDGDGDSWPGAPEPCDGPDLDCDGEPPPACDTGDPDPPEPPQGCGCASAPPGGGPWMWLVLVTAMIARARCASDDPDRPGADRHLAHARSVALFRAPGPHTRPHHE